MPRISVLMPVRNCELYIEDALNSILKQTFTDFNIVVIDDFSTDTTYEKIQSLAEREKRIMHKRVEKHIGFQHALNVGLSLCDSEYVARQDGDDLSYETRFAEQLTFLKSNPTIKLVGTAGRFFSDIGVSKDHYVPENHAEILKGTLMGKNTFIHASWMVSREAMSMVGEYNPYILAEDKDYLVRFTEHFTVANIPLKLYKIRTHSASITSSTKYDRVLTRSVSFMNYSLRLAGKEDVFGLKLKSTFIADRIPIQARNLMRLGIEAARSIQRSRYRAFLVSFFYLTFVRGSHRLRMKLMNELWLLLMTRIRRVLRIDV